MSMTRAESEMFRDGLRRWAMKLGREDCEMARMIGVSESTYSDWMNGVSKPRRKSVMKALAATECETLAEFATLKQPGGLELHDGAGMVNNRATEVLTTEAIDRVEYDLRSALRSVEALRLAFAGPDPAAALGAAIARRVQSDIRHANESDPPSVPNSPPSSGVRPKKVG